MHALYFTFNIPSVSTCRCDNQPTSCGYALRLCQTETESELESCHYIIKLYNHSSTPRLTRDTQSSRERWSEVRPNWCKETSNMSWTLLHKEMKVDANEQTHCLGRRLADWRHGGPFRQNGNKQGDSHLGYLHMPQTMQVGAVFQFQSTGSLRTNSTAEICDGNRHLFRMLTTPMFNIVWRK